MSSLKALALALLLAGVALVVSGIVQGDVRVALVLIVPVVYGTGILPALGMVCLLASAVVWSIARVREPMPTTPRGEEARGDGPRAAGRSGGVVLLGPIPFVWGSDRKALVWAIVARAALLLLGLWFSSRSR